MKKILFLLIALLLWSACKNKQEIDTTYITQKFDEHASHIKKLEYRIQRIDTFQDGSVWNHKGVVLVEKDFNDKLFGFSFYSKRNDVPKEFVYDKGIEFTITDSTKTYKADKGSYGFMGSPGGQMIPRNLFHLDSVYKSLTLTETENSYILKYEFEDDTVYNLTSKTKSIELTKDNFFPIKITSTSSTLDGPSFNQTLISDIKINEQTQHSIEDYKSKLENYAIIQPEKRQPNRLLDKPVPTITLPDLSAQNKNITLSKGKLTLLDFWEPWCGPCIASFPKVETLKNKYSTQLDIIGIVSENNAAALRLVDKKKVTFLNLVGNKKLLEDFTVNGFPHYFLIDQKGIVRKEYFGFSDQIEKDIREMLE